MQINWEEVMTIKMASARFDKTLFEKEIGKLDEAMQNKIALFGTTVESLDDKELEIDVSPNRPDLLSYQGFKRSFLSFLGKSKGAKQYKINKPEKDYYVKIDSSVKEIRPYTVCAIVKNLKLNDEKIKEIIEIQEKLHTTIGRKRKKLAIGIYPLEKITLPITFKALEPDKIRFIPLEMERELSGLQILQKHPTGREYAHLLSGKTKFPVFVDSKDQVLSMPPIINSQLTGKITEKTKDVFIELSGFDLETQEKGLNIIVSALADMGGKIYAMELRGLKKITPDFSLEKNKISLENTNKTLGLNLSEKELKNYLEKMGHDYNKGQVETPCWRTDVLHEIDLIEDVAIAYGYDNFEPEIPKIASIGEENPKETLKKKISEILSGLNMLEVSNYHLTKKRDMLDRMNLKTKEIIEIEESKTEYSVLRGNLIHYCLKNFSENIDSEYPQNIFETGKVFSEESSKIIEKEHLSIGLAPGNFTDLKKILKYLFEMLGIELIVKEPEEEINHFVSGRVAEIFIAEKSIGYLGEIHPKILKNWKIKMPISLLEISLEEIFEKLA